MVCELVCLPCVRHPPQWKYGTNAVKMCTHKRHRHRYGYDFYKCSLTHIKCKRNNQIKFCVALMTDALQTFSCLCVFVCTRRVTESVSSLPIYYCCYLFSFFSVFSKFFLLFFFDLFTCVISVRSGLSSVFFSLFYYYFVCSPRIFTATKLLYYCLCEQQNSTTRILINYLQCEIRFRGKDTKKKTVLQIVRGPSCCLCVLPSALSGWIYRFYFLCI